MSERESFVNDNIGLAHSCAMRFRGKGIEYDDLFQAGCVGLIKAADHFDASLGYRFSTYAVPVIVGEIKRLFRDGGTVRVSRSIKELGLKINRETELFERTHGREPTVGELSEILGVPVEAVSEAIAAAIPPVSLTAPTEDGENQTDIPVDAPDEKITELMSLRTELDRLPENDRMLISLRFFRHKTQSETARILGMTQVQVSRRERKILHSLRERLAG